MNRKTGEIAVTHHTGAVTRINPDGSIDIQTGVYSAGPAPLNVNVSGDVTINSMGNTTVSAFGNVDIQATTGQITLGNNLAKQLVCNIPNCLICRCSACCRQYTGQSLKDRYSCLLYLARKVVFSCLTFYKYIVCNTTNKTHRRQNEL